MQDALAYTTIGHRGLAICNPVASETLDAAIELAAPPREDDARAVDVGCGKGELLIRLAERHGCRGVGIDTNPAFVEEARRAAERRAPGRVAFVEGDARHHAVPPGSVDLAAVVGAAQALGGAAAALEALVRITRQGGHVLLGEGFWRRPPGPVNLATLGLARDDLHALEGLIAAVHAVGIRPLRVFVAGDDDWDAYEAAHHANLAAYAEEHPEDPQALRLWARRQAWNDAYLRAGRHCLGFALIVGRRE